MGHLASEAITPNIILRNESFDSFVLSAFAFRRYGYEDVLGTKKSPLIP